MSTTHTKIIALILIITLVSTVMAIDFSDHTVSKPRGYKTVHMPRTTTTAPTLTPTPIPTPVITPPRQDVSQYHYRVMVLDGINQSDIRKTLQYIPNLFSFELVPDDPLQYSFQNGYAVPQSPRLITVFNGTMHGYTHPNAMGYYYGNGMSTIVYLGQDPYILSWPILHECLHEALPKSGSTIDQDQQPTFIDQWNAWMGERGLGFWSGSDPQISAGWVRLKQDFLVSQCLTL